ncbi:D-inositol-3-phosphate glycosyltransferase [Arthrobacter jiangjiafuii]|uniref:D-inositol-3-phosphate glycosyltransferase n=1 Tax=Arthrobacter jiangjiafuii TaxID=2817475 RepID=A0A975M8U6_9MICC|nr:D-inositol-3-phosphate glycosyltransferase [Arthrobacter jiangjiafuii]MBP3042154.1 D-inositol-3-phosphate glycosyltransferase [Arthrobacter jiangjiafuii]QWC11894.1 D-inositol-3-phosphate glycosyltransferase [Arthrobacter jiangjiafuii]
MLQVKRVAMLSLHTSPLEQPGSGDAGGMNVYVRSVAMELAKAGVEVEIFTRAWDPAQPAAVELAPGVTVRHIDAGPRRRIAKESLPGLAPELASGVADLHPFLANRHFDVIHSHYWVSGTAGLAVSRAWNLPLVHTMHTMARVKNLQLQPGEKLEPQVRIDGEQEIVDGATRLIANTSTEAGELESLYGADPRAVDVVAPGVDLQVFSSRGSAAARARLGIPDDVFHIVFAGRIQPMKGPQVLVRAAAELQARRPDIPLRISILGAGSGSEVLELQPLVDSLGLNAHVALYPPVEAAVLADWFRAADVVAVPSFSESFGLVALEAQACGTPVLAANVGGLPKAVSHGRTGLLVDGHDSARWSAELERLYDDAGLRRALGYGAAVHASAFGWKRTAQLTNQSYRQAAEQFSTQSVR